MMDLFAVFSDNGYYGANDDFHGIFTEATARAYMSALSYSTSAHEIIINAPFECPCSQVKPVEPCDVPGQRVFIQNKP